jgi:hypothetical protein
LNAHKAERDLLTAQLNLQLGKFQDMFAEELRENLFMLATIFFPY